MRPIHVVLAFLAIGLMSAAPRPLNEALLLLKLNGESRRWQMEDGGSSGMFGSGIQCMTIPSFVDTIKLTPSADINLCFPPDAGWDGGCNAVSSDINYGDPQVAGVSRFVVLQPSTTRVCMVPASGSANVPAFQVR